MGLYKSCQAYCSMVILLIQVIILKMKEDANRCKVEKKL